MNQNTWIVLSFLLSAVVTGAWWFAAVRLRRHWSLFAMAGCSTIGVLLSAVWTFSAVYHQPSGLAFGSVEWMRGLQFALGTAQTVCFVLFVAWLVGRSSRPRIA